MSSARDCKSVIKLASDCCCCKWKCFGSHTDKNTLLNTSLWNDCCDSWWSVNFLLYPWVSALCCINSSLVALPLPIFYPSVFFLSVSSTSEFNVLASFFIIWTYRLPADGLAGSTLSPSKHPHWFFVSLSQLLLPFHRDILNLSSDICVKWGERET